MRKARFTRLLVLGTPLFAFSLVACSAPDPGMELKARKRGKTGESATADEGPDMGDFEDRGGGGPGVESIAPPAMPGTAAVDQAAAEASGQGAGSTNGQGGGTTTGQGSDTATGPAAGGSTAPTAGSPSGSTTGSPTSPTTGTPTGPTTGSPTGPTTGTPTGPTTTSPTGPIGGNTTGPIVSNPGPITVGGSGPATPSGGGVIPPGGGGIGLAGGVGSPTSTLPTIIPRDAPLGSNWHADPDSDGIPSASDHCPAVWDPTNADTNNDGVGDACDPLVDAPVVGAAINDLRAEHVTPYGAWFTFRSNENNEWGYSTDIAWSESRAEIESQAGFDAAIARGNSSRMRVNERLGDRIPVPAIVTSMKPGTTYYAAVRDNGGRIGKVLTLKTSAAPSLSRPGTFPRVYATHGLLGQLRQRDQAGDAGWTKWKNLLAPKIDRALAGTDIEDEKYCNAAATLYHGTGDPAYLAKAKALHGKLISRWEAGPFSGNGYRWADAALAICTDLLWNDLDGGTRERAVRATLAPDEHAMAGSDFRLEDTDESHSSIRTWLIDGLLGCETPGISQAVSDRSCKILDKGMRFWHGLMLVQARRDKGFFAMSGGHMPDSTRYAQGSSQYWTESFWTMANQGVSPVEYAPWIANNLLATYIHPTTPRMKGFASYGDIDKYQTGADPEPNSCTIDTFHFDVLAMQMGLLKAAGRTREAGWAKSYLDAVGPSDNYQNRYHMLMFDTATTTPVDYKTTAPPSYLDSGFGMMYDRTSWGPQASMMTMRAGWSGIDHSQEDQGHFQLYRRGRWLTHESMAYEGEATHAQGHNVMQLGLLYNHGVRRDGQFAFRNNGAAVMMRRSSGAQHMYVHGDYTGTYQSGFTNYFAFDKVERALVWLKSNDQGSPDTVVIYDHVVNAPGAPAAVGRNFQLHLDGNPTIQGKKASLELDATPVRQKLDVTVLLPATATLATTAPAGAPGNSTDAIYTHRLVANPNTTAPDLRFVTVLQGADVGGAPAAAPVAVDAGGYVGARVGTTVVLFPKAPLNGNAAVAPPTVTLDATGANRFYLAGFTPGVSYTVTATGSGAALTLTARPGTGIQADRGGMLIFSVGGGNVVGPG